MALLVLCGTPGCAHRARTPADRPAADPCGATIAGEEQLTAPIVLLGETHGTAEIPALFGHLVCRAASRHPQDGVLVGLEIFSSAQPAIDAFLAGDGSEAAKRALVAQEFWQNEYQDGRPSAARLDLLDALRRFRAGGLKVAVRAVDPQPAHSADRDGDMAAALLRAIKETHPAQTLMLVGDVHSRILKGYPWDPGADYLSMGAHLRAARADVVGLHPMAGSGSAWMCLSAVAAECGVNPLRPKQLSGTTPRIALEPEALDKSGWSGTLFLSELTPSRPARLLFDDRPPGK